MITCSIEKWVSTAANTGHTCSTENNDDNNKEKLLWGPLWDHLEWWAMDSRTPYLQASTVYLPVQPSSSFLKIKEKIWMKNVLLPQNKETKGKWKTEKEKAFLSPLSSYSFIHATDKTSLSANNRL